MLWNYRNGAIDFEPINGVWNAFLNRELAAGMLPSELVFFCRAIVSVKIAFFTFVLSGSKLQ